MKNMKKIYYPNCSTLVVEIGVINPLLIWRIFNTLVKEFKFSIEPKPTMKDILAAQDKKIQFVIKKNDQKHPIVWDGEQFYILFGDKEETREWEIEDFMEGALDKFNEHLSIEQI